jgi:phage-related protein
MPKLFNIATNKRGLIVYGGESSSDYGMVVSEAPAYERPNRKQTIYTVPGRNGAVVFQDDAWEDVVRSYNVWIAEGVQPLSVKVSAFEAMLNSMKGWQRLEDSFEPDVFRLAYYSGGNDFSNKMTQYGEATINFTCRPERFLKTGEQEVTVINNQKIVNQTRFTAKPLIHIEGSGTVTVTIGGDTISASITDYINIDCETMNAYRLAAENKNSDISGSFPKIIPGENTVGITGTTTKVTIVPRYFTI